MTTTTATTERDETILILRRELRRRSGKAWSVRGGRGTGWGWITVTAPPARQVNGGLSDADREELSALFGEDVHWQGLMIPASREYRTEYVDRVRGLAPVCLAQPYWD